MFLGNDLSKMILGPAGFFTGGLTGGAAATGNIHNSADLGGYLGGDLAGLGAGMGLGAMGGGGLGGLGGLGGSQPGMTPGGAVTSGVRDNAMLRRLMMGNMAKGLMQPPQQPQMRPAMPLGPRY